MFAVLLIDDYSEEGFCAGPMISLFIVSACGTVQYFLLIVSLFFGEPTPVCVLLKESDEVRHILLRSVVSSVSKLGTSFESGPFLSPLSFSGLFVVRSGRIVLLLRLAASMSDTAIFKTTTRRRLANWIIEGLNCTIAPALHPCHVFLLPLLT